MIKHTNKGTKTGLNGKTVENRHGPAAVSGDKIHIGHCPPKADGKAWKVG